MSKKRWFFKGIVSLVTCFMLLGTLSFATFAAESSSEGNATATSDNYRMTNVSVGEAVYDGDLAYRPIEFDIVPANQVSESEPEEISIPLNGNARSSDERTYLVFNSVQNSIQYYSTKSDRYFGFSISATKNDGTAIDKSIAVRLYNNLSGTSLISKTIRANGSVFSDEFAINTSSSYHQFKFTPESGSNTLCHISVYAYYR